MAYNRPRQPMYSPELIEHFEHPRNVGEIEQPDAAVRVENPACGDIMQLTLRIEAGRIVEARYRTRGCVAAIACGSALTEIVRGMKIEEARALSRQVIVDAVGGLRSESQHASHLAIDALRAAVGKISG